MKILIGILLISAVQATEWNCVNHDMEIQCSSGKCSSEEGFSPLSVTFDDKGAMSLCAYSGCWKGTGKILKTEDFIIIAGHNLKFSTSKDDRTKENAVIAFDIHDRIAVIKVSEFAMPMTCKILD